jgi:peptide/nickel transport system permease protein
MARGASARRRLDADEGGISVRAYVARRLLLGALTLVLISVGVFWLLRLGPGDIAEVALGQGASQEQVDAMRQHLGLNEPIQGQYLRWIKQVFSGDLGESAISGTPVTSELTSRLPITAELLIITMLVTVAIGIPAGIISALYRNSVTDYVVRVAATIGLSVPVFWVATLVILLPTQWWGYSPPLNRTVGFFDDPLGNLRQFVPPAVILGAAAASGIMRLTRSTLLEVLSQDYIRTARSKGLRDRAVIWRHALRNALVPVVTVLGLQVAALLGGTVIIEQIFNLRGLGNYIYQSIFIKDYAVVQTMALYIALVVVLMNLIVDILYAWLNPRIRYG